MSSGVTASTDNTLRDLHNSSYGTKAESITVYYSFKIIPTVPRRALRDSRRALRDSRSAGRHSRRARWLKNCKYICIMAKILERFQESTVKVYRD